MHKNREELLKELDAALEELKKAESMKDATVMQFEDALREVKAGKGMRLPQWSPEVVIRCQVPDDNSKMTSPYLYVESRFGRVPWRETFPEMFDCRWEVVE